MEKVFVFIFGLIVGSFLNVCIYRMPKGQSIVMPASHCPDCVKPIKWYDNIPVISYFILRGRCRHCSTRISLRYPLVEVLTGVMAFYVFSVFGYTPVSVSYFVMICALIIATFVDFDINEIPDEVSIGGCVIGLLLSAIFPIIHCQTTHVSGLVQSLLGVLAGGGSIYLMGFFGEMVFKKEAMGGGDVKLMGMVGAFLGWKFAILTFFMAPLFGSVIGIALKIKDGREIIPYGPYLSIAAVISMFWGQKILSLIF